MRNKAVLGWSCPLQFFLWYPCVFFFLYFMFIWILRSLRGEPYIQYHQDFSLGSKKFSNLSIVVEDIEKFSLILNRWTLTTKHSIAAHHVGAGNVLQKGPNVVVEEFRGRLCIRPFNWGGKLTKNRLRHRIPYHHQSRLSCTPSPPPKLIFLYGPSP